jgi:hypothetical protein
MKLVKTKALTNFTAVLDSTRMSKNNMAEMKISKPCQAPSDRRKSPEADPSNAIFMGTVAIQ